MTQKSPQPRNRHRIKWSIATLVVMMLPWLSVILLAHEYLPGSIALTNGLFGAALVASYFGGWSFAIVVSSSPRLMFMRGFASTLFVLASLLILEIPAMLGMVHWTLVMRQLSGEGADYEA